MYIDTSHLTRGGKTYTRHLLRKSYRAHGKVLHRTIANVSHCSAAEIEALRLALRHKGELEYLGPLQDAITLKLDIGENYSQTSPSLPLHRRKKPMGAGEAFWHPGTTAGRRRTERLVRFPQEALQHGLDSARLQHHLQRPSQPLAGMLFLMPSDDVAIALDLCSALLDEPAFDVTPGELDHHHIFVHCLVGSHAKVRQSQSGFQVKIVHLA